METFPTDIQRLIVKYAQDMALLEVEPLPRLLSAYRRRSDKFVTGVLRDLLFTYIPRHELAESIKSLLNVPAQVFLEYWTACVIHGQRCRLWKLDTRIPLSWECTLPHIMFFFVETGDVDAFHEDLFFCLNSV